MDKRAVIETTLNMINVLRDYFVADEYGDDDIDDGVDADWQIAQIDNAHEIIETLLPEVRVAESEDQERKANTHIVIKREDILKYLTDEQIKYLNAVLNTIADGRKNDGKQTDNSYYICNTDEPYADEMLEVILKGENKRKLTDSEVGSCLNDVPLRIPVGQLYRKRNAT